MHGYYFPRAITFKESHRHYSSPSLCYAHKKHEKPPAHLHRSVIPRQGIESPEASFVSMMCERMSALEQRNDILESRQLESCGHISALSRLVRHLIGDEGKRGKPHDRLATFLRLDPDNEYSIDELFQMIEDYVSQENLTTWFDVTGHKYIKLDSPLTQLLKLTNSMHYFSYPECHIRLGLMSLVKWEDHKLDAREIRSLLDGINSKT